MRFELLHKYPFPFSWAGITYRLCKVILFVSLVVTFHFIYVCVLSAHTSLHACYAFACSIGYRRGWSAGLHYIIRHFIFIRKRSLKKLKVGVCSRLYQTCELPHAVVYCQYQCLQNALKTTDNYFTSCYIVCVKPCMCTEQ